MNNFTHSGWKGIYNCADSDQQGIIINKVCIKLFKTVACQCSLTGCVSVRKGQDFLYGRGRLTLLGVNCSEVALCIVIQTVFQSAQLGYVTNYASFRSGIYINLNTICSKEELKKFKLDSRARKACGSSVGSQNYNDTLGPLALGWGSTDFQTKKGQAFSLDMC